MKRWLTCLCLCVSGLAGAQEASTPPAPLRGSIELNADDKPAFAAPAADWDRRLDGAPQGRLEMVSYDSRTVGTRRRMLVYTPPAYDPQRAYPVLYLLHGIGGDETEWQRFTTLEVLLDRLIAEGRAQPMIVVMPNGRAQANDRPEGNVFAAAPAFARFERDLLDDVIPAIESHYRTRTDREGRALAGLSMGGGQALNFGLAHIDRFAWVGGFSAAPNTRPPAELLPDPAAARRLKLLWLSCGSQDGLLRVSQGVHAHLKAQGLPHVWHVPAHGHDAAQWKQDLYWFAQRLFQ
ncbi:MAG TPA: alpha/beta hydrolase-fold protein [Roseateles sp.]